MTSPDSVKAKLRRIAVSDKRPFDYMMLRYVVERLLYRLSISEYKDNFVLKGGMFIYTVLGDSARLTRDVDLLARNLLNTEAELLRVFRVICQIETDDAIRFDLDSFATERIIEGGAYEGVHIKVTGYIDKSKQVIQFDVGYGDVVVPEAVVMEYPSLLDMECPKILAYSYDSVVAEKFEAMIALAEANSRMKDFYDIFMLSRHFSFDGAILQEAIQQTLHRRATPTSEFPVALTDDFANSRDKLVQWAAFQRNTQVAEGISFQATVTGIREFLLPVYQSMLSHECWSSTWSWVEQKWR